MQNRVYFFDTTLRDGEPSPGATMNLQEKLRLAHQLEVLGVDIMEAGFPASSPGDFESVRTIAAQAGDIQVAGLARCVDSDIDRCWEAVKCAKNPRIHTFLSTSPLHMKHKLRKDPEECSRWPWPGSNAVPPTRTTWNFPPKTLRARNGIFSAV